MELLYFSYLKVNFNCLKSANDHVIMWFVLTMKKNPFDKQLITTGCKYSVDVVLMSCQCLFLSCLFQDSIFCMLIKHEINV